ncbi:hypothetical protein POL25_36745 [Nannocystis sp. bb15-2]|uniref:Uncharacterized protein n=2 Tax=Nannocystis bainbridge TaxID=2995303 RepID=A0ABT5E9G5_9BACT|nr:hypothetical protein [Nannocystis bainbridge]
MRLMPDELKSAGIVTVEVDVEGADAVSMSVDLGEPVALVPMNAGTFTGEIAVFGESWNGTHDVVAIATRDEEVSEPWPATFTVAASAAGGEAWLKKSSLVPSYGNAIDVDDQGGVVELFTYSTPEGQRCHLRRRDTDGEVVWLGDSRWIAHGFDCAGEDVKFAPDGTIWALVNVYENGFGRWQIWHLDDDGLPLGQTPEEGNLTHMGRGLDVNVAGDVLLCGTRPATPGEDDAWVRLRRVDTEPWTQPWDYRAPYALDKVHKFSERTQDCAFVEDRIVVVGDAVGPHEQGNPDIQTRGFAVEFSFTATVLADVANPAALAWHSGNQALAPGHAGGYVVAGDNCNAMVSPCNATKGVLRWFSLGATQVEMQPTANAKHLTDIAWSAAGYAVVAAQGLQNEDGFLVQGWSSGAAEPVLHYQGGPTKLQVATGIAADQVGFIFAGGYFQELDDTLAAGVAKVHPY